MAAPSLPRTYGLHSDACMRVGRLLPRICVRIVVFFLLVRESGSVLDRVGLFSADESSFFA